MKFEFWGELSLYTYYLLIFMQLYDCFLGLLLNLQTAEFLGGERALDCMPSCVGGTVLILAVSSHQSKDLFLAVCTRYTPAEGHHLVETAGLTNKGWILFIFWRGRGANQLITFKIVCFFGAVSETFALTRLLLVFLFFFTASPQGSLVNQCGATLPSMCTEGFVRICFFKPIMAQIH